LVVIGWSLLVNCQRKTGQLATINHQPLTINHQPLTINH